MNIGMPDNIEGMPSMLFLPLQNEYLNVTLCWIRESTKGVYPLYFPLSRSLFNAPMYSRPKLSIMKTTTFFFLNANAGLGLCIGVNIAAISFSLLKYDGVTNTFLPIVRINEKGVFKTSAASMGRSTY